MRQGCSAAGTEGSTHPNASSRGGTALPAKAAAESGTPRHQGEICSQT